MPNPIRCYHDKLSHLAIDATRHTRHLPPAHFRRCLVRNFTSSTVQQESLKSEPQIGAKPGNVSVEKHNAEIEGNSASQSAAEVSDDVLTSISQQDGHSQDASRNAGAKEEAEGAKAMWHVAPSGGFRVTRYVPTRDKVKGQEGEALGKHRISNGAHTGSSGKTQSISKFEQGEEETSKGFKIHRHLAHGAITVNRARGTKYLFRKAVPVDPEKEMSELAIFESKRRDEAIRERFLGIKRSTKHDVVNQALLDAQTSHIRGKHWQHIKARYRSHKDWQEIEKWSWNTERPGQRKKAVNHLDQDDVKEVKGLRKDEVPVAPPPEMVAQTFDILNTIGSKLQTAKSPLSVDPWLEGSEESADDQILQEETGAKPENKKAFEIDWDNLPLSPLMHQGLIKARTKFRHAKRLPEDAPEYDIKKGLKIENDYLSAMLASPIRTCRLTYARLPKDFLLGMQPLQHPETGQVWELPQGLDPQDVTPGSSSDVLVSADVLDSQSTSQVEAKPIDDWKSARDSSSVSGVHDLSIRFAGSYILQTQAAVQTISDLHPNRYAKTIPHRWRTKFGPKLSSNFHWRKDMSEFIHSLVQRQITDQLRSFESSADIDLVQACVGLDESGKQEIKSIPSFKGCAILYFGQHEPPSTEETSFYSTINAISDGQVSKLEILDDLFGRPQNVTQYSHLIRIREDDGGTALAFDMTRLLAPNFAKSLLDAGYDQPAYYMADKPGSQFLRSRLWWLAHYITQQNAV